MNDLPEVKPEHLPAKTLAFDHLELRDYFAAAALTGILASHSGETALPADDKAAKWSYQAADAMLKERTKPAA